MAAQKNRSHQFKQLQETSSLLSSIIHIPDTNLLTVDAIIKIADVKRGKKEINFQEQVPMRPAHFT